MGIRVGESDSNHKIEIILEYNIYPYLQDVSLVLAHNFGLTSMEEGKLDGKENILCLSSSNLGTGPRSKATGRLGGVVLAAYGNMLQYNYLSIMSILSHLLLSVVIYCFLYCH